MLAESMRQRPIYPEWSKDEVDLLKQYVDLGYTGSQISDMLPGRTRSAVLGKVHKLGLKMRSGAKNGGGAPPKPEPIRVPRKNERRQPKKVRAKQVVQPWARGVRIAPYHPDPRVVLSTNIIRLDFFTPKSCKYPVMRDEEGEWLFCNEARHLDDPYCKEHRDICYQPSQYRGKRR